MLKYLFPAVFAFVFTARPAAAEHVNYNNDETFEQCSEKSSDWDACTSELFDRVINDVKHYYLAILSAPELDGWMETKENARETMKDMFSSWTAYRNRRCSLEKAADQYVVTFQDPEISCNAYYAIQQKDYLGNILYTINAKNSRNPYKKSIAAEADRFEFLKIDAHDDNYNICLHDPNKKQPECVKEEISREENTIKEAYNTLLKEAPTTNKWNNGPDMGKGNFRDMFDSWVAYRNRLCSLAVFAQKQAYGEKAVTSDECILFMNKEKRELLEDLLVAAYSVLDEEAMPENEEDEEGGEELGQKIKPLTVHIPPSPESTDKN